MPTALGKPCCWPLCPKVIERGKRFCAEHAKAERARRSEKQRGMYAPNWQDTRAEITDGIRQCNLPTDYSCWAMAMFEAPDAFMASHLSLGEVCDYAAMRAEMLSLIPTPTSEAWSLFDWDWFSWDIFDWLDFTP